MCKIGAVVGVQAGMVLDLVTCGMITRGLIPLPPPTSLTKAVPNAEIDIVEWIDN